MFNNFSRKLAAALADSFLLSRGKNLFERNTREFWMPLSKADKVFAGIYIILADYSVGKFPPQFEDQAAAYQAEIDYLKSMPGDAAETVEGALRKPFWNPEAFDKYCQGFSQLWRALLSLDVKPGKRLLELGCGSGWMAEFLANAGYKVTATTISDQEVSLANKRLAALEEKGWGENLRFFAAPMESVSEHLPPNSMFDCVFVFEALHHAYDWREAIRTSIKVIAPKGWLVLANEPNLMHTFISYRVSRLTKTHEIGMSQTELINEMKKAGFGNIHVLAPRLNNLVSAHWIAGQRIT